MELFAIISTAFPTAVFTFLLVLVCLYWLVAMFGLLDLDVLDADVDVDVDLDAGGESIGGLAGLLVKLKLDGVPVTVSLSILILMAWTVCYFLALAAHVLLPAASWLHYLTGFISVVASLIIATPLTAMIIKPLKPLFKKAHANDEKSLLGTTGVVRTSRVSNDFGEAVVDVGNNELIIRIRADESNGFSRNDKVVLLEYLNEENAYRVISEKEFFGK